LKAAEHNFGLAGFATVNCADEEANRICTGFSLPEELPVLLGFSSDVEPIPGESGQWGKLPRPFQVFFLSWSDMDRVLVLLLDSPISRWD
jgi:hypothetical protein